MEEQEEGGRRGRGRGRKKRTEERKRGRGEKRREKGKREKRERTAIHSFVDYDSKERTDLVERKGVRERMRE